MNDVVLGWWHARATADAVTVLNESFVRLGAPPITARDLAALEADDEEELRQHQIGWMARRTNAALAAAGRTERVRAFTARGDETGWRLVAQTTYSACRATLGPPDPLDALWDDPSVADPVAAWCARPREEAPIENPARVATEAFERRDFRRSAQAAQIWLDRGDELLAPLCLMESLVALGKHDTARPHWPATAQRWLKGFAYTISRQQWDRLLKLHARLKLPESELVEDARGKRVSAPRV